MRQWQARQPVPAPVTSITSSTEVTSPRVTAELTTDSATLAQWHRKTSASAAGANRQVATVMETAVCMEECALIFQRIRQSAAQGIARD